MAGNKRVPAVLQELKGAWSGYGSAPCRRRVDPPGADEPIGEIPPDYLKLTEDEAQVWVETLPLIPPVLRSGSDIRTFAHFCRLEVVMRDGDTAARLKVFPALLRLLDRFGLSPGARAQMSTVVGAKGKPKSKEEQARTDRLSEWTVIPKGRPVTEDAEARKGAN